MENFNPKDLRKLYVPSKSSHKGQNGKLLIIGGSVLFHAASLWSLEVSSRIVDMVFYSSVPQNNELVSKQKEEFRDGIIVLGPGLPREEGVEKGDDDTKELTESLLKKYPYKKWVVDGGSLQTIDPKVIPQNAILTPHMREFEIMEIKRQSAGRRTKIKNTNQKLKIEERVQDFAKSYGCVILLKGEVDIVSDGTTTVKIEGGNQGMTKGGTGDVLAGLTASLYCKNDALLSASCASYINKKAGERLYEKVGIYYNASDLANEIPIVMKELIL